MSMSPDDPSFFSGLNQSITNLMNSPMGGVIAGLFNAGAPSRMPVPLGQAFGQALQTGQQFQSTGLQNAMQRLMLGQNVAKMQYMLGGPGMSTADAAQSQPSATQAPSQSQPTSGADTAQPGNPSNPAQTVDTTKISPQQMVTAPATYSDPMKDPYYNYLAGGARIGLPGWDTLAGQRQQFLLAQPGFQAAQAGAKAQAEFPWVAKENYLRYAGAPKELQPGIPAVAGGAFLPGSLQQVLGFTPGQAPTFQNQGGKAIQTGGQSTTALPQGGGTVNGFPVIQGPSKANYAFAEGQGQAATKYWEDLSSKADAAQTQNNIIDQMRGDFQTFTPSKTAQYRGKAQEWLNALGFPVDKDTVGSYESSNKLGVQLQSAMTKTLGSREAAQVFTTMGNAVPNNTLAPNGFERVADFMQGAGDYQMAKKQYAQQFADKGDANAMNSVDSTFQKYSDPSFFIISRATPEQQIQFVREMGSKQKAAAFFQKWAIAAKAGLAPPIPEIQ